MAHKQDKADLASFFTEDISAAYDKRNSALEPISANMHFLIRLLLQGLPQNARILCVGVGTGVEILSLANAYPEWSFVGVDPAAPMLDVCHQRLIQAGVRERCELIHGYVQDVPSGAHFDAVLSILVGHFVPRDERLEFYTCMQDRLKPQGFFINTELSFDLETTAFPNMLEGWSQVQKLMGATPESLEALPRMLRDTLCVLSPADVENLIRDAGIQVPVRFLQSFMIHGWYGKKG